MHEENREKLERLLEYLDIKFESKTRIALNIDCPYCPDDEGQHLGLFLDKLTFSCWKCKTGGSLFDVINELSGITREDFDEFFDSSRPLDEKSVLSQIKDIVNGKEDVEFAPARDVQWPPPGSVSLAKYADPQALQFLETRGISYDFAIQHDVWIGMSGRYTGRFIIPVIFEGVVVAFQARDMTGKSDAKYLTEGDISYFLYNFDNVDESKPVAVTEGIFDCWVCDNGVASFTAALSHEQICLMLEKDPPYWILAWDIGEDGSDAYWKSKKVLKELLVIFGGEKINYVTLPAGEDLSSLGSAKVKEILENSVGVV